MLTTDLPAPDASELSPLTTFEGPWSADEPGLCSVRSVESVDDVLVVGTRARTFFVRFCSGD
ncbi:MAG: hypothetical protein M3020_20440 [Myxococcota bacterium]|nr:hypothetical protein [Myxococcota bacterium]